MSTTDIDRTEWLTWRQSGIGASDVAGILGISPWQSPYSVWTTKTTPVPDSDEDNEAQGRGRDLEPVLAKWFHRERPEMYVAGEQTRCTHPEHDWALCTVDGFVFETAQGDGPDITDALGGFEAKSTIDSPKKWDTDGIPSYYQAQAQYSMWITGLSHWWFGVMHPFWAFRVYELARDEADIALIAQRCTEFWNHNVLADIAPPIDGHQATTEILRSAKASTEGAIIDLLDPLHDVVVELVTVKRQIKRLSEQQAEHENVIRAALDEATEGYWHGERIVSWREQSATRIDAKALRAGAPEIAEKFSTTSTSRVLRLHLKED